MRLEVRGVEEEEVEVEVRGGSLWIPDNDCVSTRRALQRSPPSLPGSLLPVH